MEMPLRTLADARARRRCRSGGSDGWGSRARADGGLIRSLSPGRETVPNPGDGGWLPRLLPFGFLGAVWVLGASRCA
jgi:hypothetical protein